MAPWALPNHVSFLGLEISLKVVDGFRFRGVRNAPRTSLQVVTVPFGSVGVAVPQQDTSNICLTALTLLSHGRPP